VHEQARRTYRGNTARMASLSLAGAIVAIAACSTGTATPGATPGSDSGPSDGDSGAPATGSDSGGASAESGPTGPVSVCAGAGTRILGPADAFIDDFEEAVISPGWSSFNDVQPTPNSFLITQVAGGAAGTAHSGKYAGTGAKIATAGGYGVGTVYNVAIDPAAGILCVDISAFDGVAFWAKAGTAGSKVALNFVLPQTNMAGTDSQGRPNGGDCKTKCFNHPYVTVTLTADWAQYSVKFADAAGGSAKVANVVQELAWLSPDSDWDFSIDEIAFYKGTAPTGPVGTGDAGAGGDDGGTTEDAASSD
jgi:hypothetical protein